MSQGAWKTPLGNVEIDSVLARQLIEACTYLKEDYSAHRFEHSIEVQLPILQYLFGDFKFVPIVISPAQAATYKEIGKQLAIPIKERQDKLAVIASSDMTHYEPDTSARQKDQQAIDAILQLDMDLLLKRIGEQDISMCGFAAVCVLISIARHLGIRKASLVSYQTSAETSGDKSSVVGYAGILIG
jgi:hypothetical protein